MDGELGGTGGSANQTTMLEALRSCIAEARADLRPYFTNTVEIAKSCEGRGICLKDVFCAVIGDSKHRRQLEVTFRDGSGSVPADPELASFWGRAAAEYEALEASGKVPQYDANTPPPSLYAERKSTPGQVMV